jgi:predicted oxidoreductase
MQRVRLGEIELSRIVYGLWRIGDDADTSQRHIQAKLEACLDQGITHRRPGRHLWRLPPPKRCSARR